MNREVYVLQAITYEAAKLSYESPKGILSYNGLKNTLRVNFKLDIWCYSIHKKLDCRQKNPTESLMEYAFIMTKIAAQGMVGRLWVFDYEYYGIPDSTPNKM